MNGAHVESAPPDEAGPEHPYISFSRGLVVFGVGFLLGVFAVMMTIVKAEYETASAERHIGQCLEACTSKRMEFIKIRDVGCVCRSPYGETVKTSTHSARPRR